MNEGEKKRRDEREEAQTGRNSKHEFAPVEYCNNMKKGRRLLLWPPFNSISLPTEQEAEPREWGGGLQEEVADAYFPAREEPPAAPTVLSRETRATLSSAERH